MLATYWLFRKIQVILYELKRKKIKQLQIPKVGRVDMRMEERQFYFSDLIKQDLIDQNQVLESQGNRNDCLARRNQSQVGQIEVDKVELIQMKKVIQKLSLDCTAEISFQATPLVKYVVMRSQYFDKLIHSQTIKQKKIKDQKEKLEKKCNLLKDYFHKIAQVQEKHSTFIIKYKKKSARLQQNKSQIRLLVQELKHKQNLIRQFKKIQIQRDELHEAAILKENTQKDNNIDQLYKNIKDQKDYYWQQFERLNARLQQTQLQRVLRRKRQDEQLEYLRKTYQVEVKRYLLMSMTANTNY